MFPVLFDVAGFKVFTSGAMWLVGFCLSATVLLKISVNQKVSYWLMIRMALVCLLGGIVGARLGYVHLNWTFYMNNPIEILKFYEGGMVYYWGFGGGLIGAYSFWRGRSGWIRICDIMILSLVPAHVMGRLGCYLHGCCYGLSFQKLPYLEWLLVRFPADNILRHPVQLYSGIGLTIIFVILWQIYKKTDRPGLITVVYIYTYAIFRFSIEFIRDDARGYFMEISSISTSQGISLLSVLLITIYLLLIKTRLLSQPRTGELPKT